MSTGPLAVRFGDFPTLRLEAGTRDVAGIDVENAGTAAWRGGLFVSSHWLDDRGNAIVWDGPRVDAPALAPGERTRVGVELRVPIPPGSYRLAFDMVAERRAWFSELGSAMLTGDVDVAPRTGTPHADVPDAFERVDGWDERVAAAHADGYGVVAGAVDWNGGLLDRRPRELAPYEPGGGRVPGFSAPLLAPSTLTGVQLEPLGEIAGLPAFAAPQDEPWVYDGRIVLRRRR